MSSSKYNWENLIKHARFWREQAKKSLGEGLTNLNVLDIDGKSYIFGLGCLKSDKTPQTLLFVLLNNDQR